LSGSDQNQISRRDFIKETVDIIGGLIGASIGIRTHLGCRVWWHPDQEHYISPCHDGHFDKMGNVVSGPPPRPLDEYVTRIENGNLFVTLPPFKRHA